MLGEGRACIAACNVVTAVLLVQGCVGARPGRPEVTMLLAAQPSLIDYSAAKDDAGRLEAERQCQPKQYNKKRAPYWVIDIARVRARCERKATPIAGLIGCVTDMRLAACKVGASVVHEVECDPIKKYWRCSAVVGVPVDHSGPAPTKIQLQ